MTDAKWAVYRTGPGKFRAIGPKSTRLAKGAEFVTFAVSEALARRLCKTFAEDEWTMRRRKPSGGGER